METTPVSERESLATKIAKIMLKAENTDSEHEADIFMAKAQELMLRYQIDHADVRKAKEGDAPEKIVEVEFEVGKRGAGVWGRRNLAYAISQNLPVKGLTSNWKGTFSFLGFESDVEFAQLLYASLLTHGEAELKQALKTKPDWTHGATFRANFYDAYVNRVRGRLSEQRRQATEAANAAIAEERAEETGEQVEEIAAEVSTSTALVIKERIEQVEDFVSEKYPNLRTVRPPATQYCGNARSAGDSAGKRADLTPRTGKVGAANRELSA